MRGIHKRFGAVLANQDVVLRVKRGSLHGLVGENGAGKSTLMSILYGFYEADAGQIEVDGRPVRIRHAQDAMACQIGMVHQHFMLVDSLTVLDNILLGAESSAWLPRAARTARAQVQALMASTGLHVSLDALIADVTVGERQRVEILKTLFRGARVLILDEPTAVLTPLETQQLFTVLRRLREQGRTVIIITHKLKEVMDLCDQVTVMRAGRVVCDLSVEQTSVEDLAYAMVGRAVESPGTASTHSHARRLHHPATLLQADDLHWRDALGVERLRGVSLRLHAGEIVGVAGVSGNGQSELLDLLSGLLVPTQGQLALLGQNFHPSAWLTPTQARTLGLAHVPEDRHARALVMGFAAWESAVLGYEQRMPYATRLGRMCHAAMRSATRDMMLRFDVRPPHPQLGSAKFSGGNQQKLVLARELGQSPRVLLVGQPTRGVDIGAIEFIHAQLRALRKAGCAVLLVSSELDEVLALADRVLVMNQGGVTGELAREACDETQLALLMAQSPTSDVPTR